MDGEKLYYLKYELPEEKSSYLRTVVQEINATGRNGREINDNFHITIKERTLGRKEKVRYDLQKWLQDQTPFDISLNEVNYFEQKSHGVIYLTPRDKSDLDQISDFRHGICEILKSNTLGKQYVPHVTLLKGIPFEKLDGTQRSFSDKIIPFRVNISEILIEEKDYNGENERVQRYNLGTNSIFSSL